METGRKSRLFTCSLGRDRDVSPRQPVDLTLPCLSPRLKNGELIYGCKDARSPVADWSELAHHLKPFFFPSNGLAGGPHCTRAVIRELVRVITRVLLSGSDKGRAGTLRLGPGPRGPRVCEASPFGRSLRRQGRPRWARGWGCVWCILPGSCLTSRSSRGSSLGPVRGPHSRPRCPPAQVEGGLYPLPVSPFIWVYKLQYAFGP